MSDFKDPRDRRFIASAGFIGLIVIAGIIVVILRLVGGDTGEGDAGTGPSPSQPSSGADSTSACGLPEGDQAIPTAAPTTKWYFKGKLAVPSSPDFGPAKGADENSVATCFGHNPSGALFAAATIAAETSSFSSVAEEAIRAHIAPGDLRDALIRTLDPAPGPLAQIVGFKFEDHTRDRGTVTLATRVVDGPNAGAIGATPMTLVWVNGDWQQQLQPSATTVVITSLDGFIAWSGIS